MDSVYNSGDLHHQDPVLGVMCFIWPSLLDKPKILANLLGKPENFALHYLPLIGKQEHKNS